MKKILFGLFLSMIIPFSSLSITVDTIGDSLGICPNSEHDVFEWSPWPGLINATCLNVPGSTIDDWTPNGGGNHLESLWPRVLSKEAADVIIVSVGTNDIFHTNYTSLNYYLKMQSITGNLKRHGYKRVIWLSFADRPPIDINKYLEGLHLNAIILGACQQHDINPIECVDIRRDIKFNRHTLDGVHLNEEGNKIYADLILNHLGETPTPQVPEPASAILMNLGLFMLALLGFKK